MKNIMFLISIRIQNAEKHLKVSSQYCFLLPDPINKETGNEDTVVPTSWVQSLLIDAKSVYMLFRVWIHDKYQDQAPAVRS